MWLLIILIAFALVVPFFFDLRKQKKQIKREGGMTNKYRVLVHGLLNGDPDTKIHEVKDDHITLGLITQSGSTTFFILQSFGKVTIQWRLKNLIYGNHELQWIFHEFDDQNRMLARIENDLVIYQDNVLSSKL